MPKGVEISRLSATIPTARRVRVRERDHLETLIRAKQRQCPLVAICCTAKLIHAPLPRAPHRRDHRRRAHLRAAAETGSSCWITDRPPCAKPEARGRSDDARATP